MRKINEVLYYEKKMDEPMLGMGTYYRGSIIIVISYDANNKEDIRRTIEKKIHSGDNICILKKES